MPVQNYFLEAVNVLDKKYKPFRTMWYEKNNKLFYGVELEVNSIRTSYEAQKDVCLEALKDIGENANIRPEGCCEYGYELVTTPATLAYHKQKLWGNYFDNAAKLVRSGDNVGIHIHFSREALTDKQLAKVICFIHDDVNQKFVSKIAGRRVHPGALWCRATKKYFNGQMDTTSATAIIHEESIRGRGAISVSSHYNGKSVECRIFKSNPTKKGVFQALEFLDVLIQYCGLCGDTEKDLQERAFLDWFTSNSKKHSYPYLYENMVELKLIEKGWKLLFRKAG